MQHRAPRAVDRSLAAALVAGLAALLAAGALVGVAGATAAPAHAADGGLRVEGGPMTFDGLAPGWSRSGTVQVHNDSPYDARIDVLVTDLTSSENSCERPEQRAPGEECDADGGELGDWLRATVTRDSGADPSMDAEPLWSGDLEDLVDGVTLSDSLPPGQSLPLRFRIELPAEAGNDTMTDSVTFTSRFVGSSAEGGESVVAGPQVTTGASGPTGGPGLGGDVLAAAGSGPQVTLPMTGGTISLWLLLLDLFLLIVGALLVRAARREPRSRTAEDLPGAHRRDRAELSRRPA